MAESAVTFLLEKLAILLKEKVTLLKDVGKEVKYIRDELERMQAFLRIADSMEETDSELKVWVKQVRDVAYDTEDVIDEFMFSLAKHHGHRFLSFFHKVVPFIVNLTARRQIASEIQDIKSRVRNIAEGHQRYHYKFHTLEKASSSSTPDNIRPDLREDALLIDEAELVGIKKSKEELIKRLMEGESQLALVSVVGMGGLGKSTLAKKVSDDQDVKKYFQNHAWIIVSQSFKIEDLLRDMIAQFYGEIKQPIPQGVDAMNSQRLKEILREFLQHKRYLIVLDDIWSLHAWEAIKHALPDSNCGGRIMITTRFADIAAAASVKSNIYYLQPLSPEESWILFCKKAFRQNICPPHLQRLSEKILKKCEGLPLAIVAVGGLLSSKDKSKTFEWEVIHRSLVAELEINDSLKNLMKILSLSYNDLPHYLKCCFLYMAIFPEDDLIEPMRLIRLWTAEGFVEVREGMTLEEVAECYLNELINRSLVQIAETTTDGRVRRCRIHDLLREHIISKSRDLNFVTIMGEHKMELHEKIRRLSIHSALDNALPNKGISHLRSLFIFGTSSLSNSSMQLLPTAFKLLKVLDFKGAPLKKFPDEVANLFHLRYLSLRSTNMCEIPASIEKLQNLQTLDLKYTYICKLPVQILKLKQLRHLLVYRYFEGSSFVPFGVKQGFEAPFPIGVLTSLQKLCCIKANDIGGLTRELSSLSQLRRLGIADLRKEDGKNLCSSIEKMKNLRSLSVSSVSEEEFVDLGSLRSPPLLLQVLYIDGRLEKLPHWLPSLHNLAKVRFGWSKLQKDPLEALKDLPNLVELELDHAYDGKYLCFRTGGFQKLKILCLVDLEFLRSVILYRGTMPCLQNLSIVNCNQLVYVPSGIELLSNLKLLEFYGMAEALAEELLPQGAKHWSIKHIPELYFSWWINGYWERYDLNLLEKRFLKRSKKNQSYRTVTGM
ncbi:hypothetical protein F0562_025678 [Nyssa sinensis]|uniref:AAA+ ATPase domain-containing protein n=1 Tax=Nyssa sinensis TaxID=561372 RepID=A0A5J5B9D7_9ASTE|nr:hypothetical protein F0562_025678 [Nyssa sinensis]